MLKQQKGLNHVGKETVGSVTLYALFYQSLKSFCFTQSRTLNCDCRFLVYSLKCRICGEPPDVGMAKAKFRVRFSNNKNVHRFFRKNVKYHSSVFMNIMGNRVIMGLMIGG